MAGKRKVLNEIIKSTKENCYMMIVNFKGEEYRIKINEDSLPKLIELNKSWHLHTTRIDLPYISTTLYLGIFDGKPKYKTLYLHRFLVDAKENDYVDHVNHNTFDNRIENLIIKSNLKNLQNRLSANRNNSTGYRNVSWSSARNKYIVQLQINGKNKMIGSFTDVHEAGEFAEKMRQKYYDNGAKALN